MTDYTDEYQHIIELASLNGELAKAVKGGDSDTIKRLLALVCHECHVWMDEL